MAQTISDPEAAPLAQKILPLARELDLDYELGLVLLVLGIAAEYRSEYREAIQFLEESLERLGEQIDPLAAGVTAVAHLGKLSAR